MRPVKISDKAMLTRLQHISKTVKCGLHSGFPPCCVAYYVARVLMHNPEQRKRYNKKLVPSAGYVRCPNCLKTGKIVNVKKCPKSCGIHSNECAGDYENA